MTIPTARLGAAYDATRLIKGGWQLAGGHGTIDRESAIADTLAYAESGITTFDCADIYTGVEELLGDVRQRWHARHGPNAPPLRVHTKCVPDLDRLTTITRADLRALIDRSRTRLRTEQLDLVQFHWWDFSVPRYVEVLQWLQEFQREGAIRLLGLTNTGLTQVVEIERAGISVAAHQVQVSLLDRRALGAMATHARTHGTALLAYGTLAGGFLHERWLGQPAPAEPLENRSLVKYRLIIDECGGWDALQALLQTLARIAAAHQTTIGTIAVAWVLAQPSVAAAIVGSRNQAHLAETLRIPTVALNADDHAALAAWSSAHPGPQGDIYALERDRSGRHGSIMRYNLNRT
jgi:aryl-alcohol dehydrogenase-like predicted oxidoreductase